MAHTTFSVLFRDFSMFWKYVLKNQKITVLVEMEQTYEFEMFSCYFFVTVVSKN